MKIKITAALAAIFISVVFSNCQTIAPIREPSISINNVEIVQITFDGMQLLCTVQVENQNPFDIPFPEIEWRLFINSNSFVSGVLQNDQRIRARNTTQVKVPVDIEYFEVFNTFASLAGRSDIDYKIALDVNFSLPILGDRVWHLEHEGEFPLPQIPKLSTPSVRIGRTDSTGAEIVVSVNIENPNVFALPPPKISYNLLINGNSYIRSNTEIAALAASSVTPIALQTTVSYASLLRSFTNLAFLREIPIQFNLAFGFDLPVFGDEIVNLQIPGTLSMPGR